MFIFLPAKFAVKLVVAAQSSRTMFNMAKLKFLTVFLSQEYLLTSFQESTNYFLKYLLIS